jgi:hypothetical protein
MMWANKKYLLNDINAPSSIASSPPSDVISHAPKMEFIMWSEDNTYFNFCAEHYIGNLTWGEPLAPLVDKLKVKEIARGWSSSVKIVPTITNFNQRNVSNFTLDTLTSLPQPYIIKPTHTSGGVVIVQNDTYRCIKGFCDNRATPLGPKAMKKAKKLLHFNLNRDFSKSYGEMQYKFVPHRIIVEEALPMHKFRDVTYWYLVDGQPIFVSLECTDDPKKRVFLSSRFQRLPMRLKKEICSENVEKPKTWERMWKIAKELGRHIPGVVRLDLYADEADVYFSEFTFTTDHCSLEFQPRVADGLLYAILHGEIPMSAVDAEFVERTIGDTSWVYVPLDGIQLDSSATTTHPSPVDLCARFSDRHRGECYNAARAVEDHPLRCLASKGDLYSSIGQFKSPTFQSVLARVDWPWACGIVVLLIILNALGIGGREKRQHRQYLSNMAYLAMVVLYKRSSPKSSGFWSPDSLFMTIQESYQVFTIVHPPSSSFIAITHIATYWFEVAAWRAKSLRWMLFWYLMYELVASYVNEFSHHLEEDNSIRCMRVSFIRNMKQYAVDDFIRAYLLPPFFVYGYLLPKFLFYFLW